jgi:diguanylate cyclase (GGDEF)-like protein
MFDIERLAAPPSYDSLTLALTRPAFLSALREHAEHARRSGNVFSVCLVDADHLRNVNDAHGLDAGDGVLAALADRLRAVLEQPAWHRFEHAVGRFDGDAFVVLARPCGLAQAETVAEALRFGVAEAPLAGIAMTVSIGVAQYRIGEPIDRLMARTERALHVAKQFGRDRVEVSSTPPSRVERAKVVGLYD